MDPYNRLLLTAELKRDEGVRLKPYTDTVGKLTIGTGRNLSDMGISAFENDHLLSNDIVRVESELDEHMLWWRSLDPVRQRVLANMCFNLGIGKLLGFKHTLHLIQSSQYTQAADAMLQSKWAMQVNQRAVRLTNMMRLGQT
ncbi:MAG: lysozyme [Glomeribacter sp. 1016415]|nr:lysozyme [Glomeribacter sp. 1016415]